MRKKKPSGKENKIDKFLPADDYNEMVANWGYEVLAYSCFGSYQGDAAYILKNKDSNQVGYVIVGYGSCSGCDALEAAYGNALELRALSQSIHNDIRWFDSAEELVNNVKSEDGPVSWYSSEQEIINFNITEAENNKNS